MNRPAPRPGDGPGQGQAVTDTRPGDAAPARTGDGTTTSHEDAAPGPPTLTAGDASPAVTRTPSYVRPAPRALLATAADTLAPPLANLPTTPPTPRQTAPPNPTRTTHITGFPAPDQPRGPQPPEQAQGVLP
ncbi:hypothetical protein GCM10010502_20440 [Kitasatospora aureofaciens]|uniref:Uncharacterized protein n=1 Tax=Kitasatospora aureofaciens TaxID=1894 RepID=A0A8H9HJ68_KITAU|nr:hypothetical protein GCM10010502_20440 [Kitasatospora aureofaciens]